MEWNRWVEGGTGLHSQSGAPRTRGGNYPSQKMALTLYGLVLVAILFVNAVAVLNEERFLARSMSLCFPQAVVLVYVDR